MEEEQIIFLDLDEIDNVKYRKPFELNNHVKERNVYLMNLFSKPYIQYVGV